MALENLPVASVQSCRRWLAWGALGVDCVEIAWNGIMSIRFASILIPADPDSKKESSFAKRRELVGGLAWKRVPGANRGRLGGGLAVRQGLRGQLCFSKIR